jgi:hypothetical protein
MDRLDIRIRFFNLPIATRAFAQGVAVILCAIMGAFAAGRFRYGSPLNLVWAALLPALIGMLLNRGTTNRIVFPVFWIVLSFATILVVAHIAGLGPD